MAGGDAKNCSERGAGSFGVAGDNFGGAEEVMGWASDCGNARRSKQESKEEEWEKAKENPPSQPPWQAIAWQVGFGGARRWLCPHGQSCWALTGPLCLVHWEPQKHDPIWGHRLKWEVFGW